MNKTQHNCEYYLRIEIVSQRRPAQRSSDEGTRIRSMHIKQCILSGTYTLQEYSTIKLISKHGNDILMKI